MREDDVPIRPFLPARRPASAWALPPAFALAAIVAGCANLESEGYRARAFEGVDYKSVYAACVQAVQIHGGSLAVTDERNGKIVADWRRYPPTDPGEARPPGSDKYRSRVEAVVERAPGGARAWVRFLIEREEAERRTALAGLAPSDILHSDDRGPTTPLQEQILAEGGAGTRWAFYRTDPRPADTVLTEAAGLVRPRTGAGPGGSAPKSP